MFTDYMVDKLCSLIISYQIIFKELLNSQSDHYSSLLLADIKAFPLTQSHYLFFWITDITYR